MPDGSRPGSLASRLTATRRVVAVEDDEGIAEFLFAYFRASGYDVVHLDPSSAAEGLAGIEAAEPDCVLLDMGLRGFSGMEIYRLLRSEPGHALLPVVVVTADATARSRTATTASSIDGFVTKPFNVNTLADVVASRIDAAREAAARDELDPESGLLSYTLLDDRIATELDVADAGLEPLSFALIGTRCSGLPPSELTDEILEWVVRKLAAEARPRLPDTVTLGRTADRGLVVLAPGTTPNRAASLLAPVMRDLTGSRLLPGGAELHLHLAAGVAGYPDHASDVDGLFMAADAALADAVDGDDFVAVAL